MTVGTSTSELTSARMALARERDLKLQEAAKIEKAIEQLDQVMETITPGSTQAVVRSNTFEGLSISEAAKKFLQSTGGTSATTREICDALLAGGYRTTARNWYMTVYASLRDTRGFTRDDKGRWHLAPEVVLPAPGKVMEMRPSKARPRKR